MEQYRTIKGDRPDLMEIEVNSPEGYIGQRIYPVLGVAEKGGEISYQTVPSDQSAEINRSRGTALGREFVAEGSDSYTAVSIERRFSVDWKDVKAMRGIENADKQGGIMAKRSVLRELEDRQADELFTGSATDASGSPLRAIMEGLPDIKRYSGKTAMVLSYSAWMWLIQHPDIDNALQRHPWILQGEQAALSVQRVVVRNMLQNIYGIEEILVGDDDHWDTNEGHMAITKLPDPVNPLSHLAAPELGKTVAYMAEEGPGDGIYITSEDNGYYRCNDYDALIYATVHEFDDNSGAKKLFTGLTGDVPTA